MQSTTLISIKIREKISQIDADSNYQVHPFGLRSLKIA